MRRLDTCTTPYATTALIFISVGSVQSQVKTTEEICPTFLFNCVISKMQQTLQVDLIRFNKIAIQGKGPDEVIGLLRDQHFSSMRNPPS